MSKPYKTAIPDFDRMLEHNKNKHLLGQLLAERSALTSGDLEEYELLTGDHSILPTQAHQNISKKLFTFTPLSQTLTKQTDAINRSSVVQATNNKNFLDKLDKKLSINPPVSDLDKTLVPETVIDLREALNNIDKSYMRDYSITGNTAFDVRINKLQELINDNIDEDASFNNAVILRDELTNIYNKFQSVLSNFNIPFQEKKEYTDGLYNVYNNFSAAFNKLIREKDYNVKPLDLIPSNYLSKTKDELTLTEDEKNIVDRYQNMYDKLNKDYLVYMTPKNCDMKYDSSYYDNFKDKTRNQRSDILKQLDNNIKNLKSKDNLKKYLDGKKEKGEINVINLAEEEKARGEWAPYVNEHEKLKQILEGINRTMSDIEDSHEFDVIDISGSGSRYHDLTKLPVLLGHKLAGNNNKDLSKEIDKIASDLYKNKIITKTVHDKITSK